MLKTVDTKEAVPEKLRDKAIETKDGKFVFDEPEEPLGDNGKTALDKERAAKKLEKERADKAEGELQKLKDEQIAKDKGITTEQLQKIRDDEAAARKPIVDENEALKKENRKLKLHDKVEQLGIAAGWLPDRIAKALKDLNPGPDGRIDLTEDGNSLVVRDEKGNIVTEKVEDFLSGTYKKESPFFYKGVDASGSGADGGGGAGSTDAYDPVAAGKAAAQVQKAGADQNKLAFK